MKKVLLGGGALLLVLGVGFALAMAFAAELMAAYLRPGHAFAAVEPPPAPDYRDPSAWVALPDREDLADLLPEGEAPVDHQASAEADVFFVHPTTYYGSDYWNPPLDEPRAAEMTAVTIAGQASAFNHCCRVYAPKYRQGTIGAFMGVDDDSTAAFRLAYADVRAAYRHFLTELNHGRPFILASHSQGTLHALRLLEEIDRAPERERLVAAYVVGYRPSVKALRERLTHVGICEGPTASGCVVGWDTHVEDADLSYDPPVYHWQGEELVPSHGVERLCTNPINWRRGEGIAPAGAHRGGVSILTPEPFPGILSVLFADGPLGIEVTGLRRPRVGQLTARCTAGRLLVPRQAPVYGLMEPGGSYHLFDYDFFYLDVQQNAVARVEAFLAARAPVEAAPQSSAEP